MLSKNIFASPIHRAGCASSAAYHSETVAGRDWKRPKIRQSDVIGHASFEDADGSARQCGVIDVASLGQRRRLDSAILFQKEASAARVTARRSALHQTA